MGKHPDGWVKDTLQFDPAAVKALAARVPHQVDAYLQTWVNACSDAGTEMPPTSDHTQAINFGLALAGNMVWAATCLTPQGKAISIAMSFAGAMVGSGTFSQSDPYPIKEIHDQVYATRDKISKSYHASANKIAAKIVGQGHMDTESQDAAIWNEVFAGVAFNNASELLAKARNAIKKAFDTFSDQYQVWQHVTEDQARTINEKMPLPKIDSWTLAKIGYGPALDARLPPILAEVRAKHPFKLKIFA